MNDVVHGVGVGVYRFTAEVACDVSRTSSAINRRRRGSAECERRRRRVRAQVARPVVPTRRQARRLRLRRRLGRWRWRRRRRRAWSGVRVLRTHVHLPRDDRVLSTAAAKTVACTADRPLTPVHRLRLHRSIRHAHVGDRRTFRNNTRKPATNKITVTPAHSGRQLRY